MVSVLESNYNDLLSKLSPDLRDRIEGKKLAHRDVLEIARFVIVKEEEDGSISVSNNVLSEKEIRKVEVTSKQIGLIRKICSASHEKVGEKRKLDDLPEESLDTKKAKLEGSVAIVRREKRKADSEPDCDLTRTTKETKRKKFLTSAERDRIAEEVGDIFFKDSKIPSAIQTNIADYISETPDAIIDLLIEKRLPGYLKNVVDLDLREIDLDYEIFCRIIDECKNLQKIILPGYVEDSWLKEMVEKLPRLNGLYIGESYTITDVGLGYIANLSSLKKLYISNCNCITDYGVNAVIHKLEKLQELIISGCNLLTENAFISIGERGETLTHLNIHDCKDLSNEGIKAIIPKLNNLQQLSIKNCTGISDEGLVTIGQLSKTLKKLEICLEDVTGEFLKHLEQDFKILKTLKLSCCKLDESNFVHCKGKFPALKSLELNYILILTHKGIDNILKGAEQLESLDLEGCDLLDDEVLKLIAEKCPNLKKLNIRYSTEITNTGLDSISKGCLDLEELNLERCDEIDDKGLKSIGENSHKIRVLNLNGCKKVTDEGINSISLGCPDLVNLNLGDCVEVTDLAIEYLSQRIDSLQVLNISTCKKITSKGINFISTWCNSLQQLAMSECAVDSKIFSELVHDFPVLHFLDLALCQDVNDHSLNRVSELFPALKILNLQLCVNITDTGVGYLKKLQKLSYIYLYGCHEITDEAVDHFIEIPELCYVDLSGCTGVSDTAVENLEDQGITVQGP